MKILIGVFGVIVFMDWRHYRIPNLCVATGAAAGLTMTYLSHSFGGVLQAMGVAGIIFAVFYPFYQIGALGAGDVKLFMMMGCYSIHMGMGGLIHYMLVTMVIAAAISIAKMLAYTESRERLCYLVMYLRKAAITGAIDPYQVDSAQKRCVVRLSIPAFLSLLLMRAGVYV